MKKTIINIQYYAYMALKEVMIKVFDFFTNKKIFNYLLLPIMIPVAVISLVLAGVLLFIHGLIKD